MVLHVAGFQSGKNAHEHLIVNYLRGLRDRYYNLAVVIRIGLLFSDLVIFSQVYLSIWDSKILSCSRGPTLRFGGTG